MGSDGPDLICQMHLVSDDGTGFWGLPRSTRMPGAAALGMMVVVAFFFAGGGRPWLVVGLIPHLVPASSWGSMAAGENRAMTPVMAGDDGVYASLLC